MTDPDDRLRDILSALLFAIVGIGAAIMALGYPLGTFRRMGPGALPLILGCLLVVAALVLAFQVRRRGGAEPLIRMPAMPSAHTVRAVVFITASLVVFALLIKPLGLFLATAALAVIARQAEPGGSFLGSVLVALILALVCSAIFVWAIGLPFRVWPI